MGTLGRNKSSDMRDLKNITVDYSIGVGRANMNKLYVDQILANKDGFPGVGAYNLKSQFDKANGHGSYSIRKKLMEEDRRLKKEA